MCEYPKYFLTNKSYVLDSKVLVRILVKLAQKLIYPQPL